MKYLVKYIIRSLGLGSFVRASRSLFYSLFDFVGTLLFFLLRTFKILNAKREFNKGLVKKILIIRLDRIGDILVSTPAIRALRHNFKMSEVHLLTSSYTKDLVINNPNIDKVLIYRQVKLSKDYDLAVALHPGIEMNYLTFVSGAKIRLGFSGWGGGFFLTHSLKDDRAKRIRHEVESALELVKTVGCETEDKSLEVSITEQGERFAEDFFRDNNLSFDDLIIVIQPGANQEYIRWKAKGFAEVSERLIKEEDARIILIGTQKERQLAIEILSLMQEKPILAIGLELTKVISLIKRSSLFIGNSSGPMHIAVALKVSVVSIFGPIHPLDSYQEWGPWGKGHIVVSKNLNCHRCNPSNCKTLACMSSITTDEVLEAVDIQLGKTWGRKTFIISRPISIAF